MFDHFDNLRRPPSSQFSVHPLDKVQPTTHQLPSPTLITQTVIPEHLSRERRVWLRCVAHKTSGSVRIKPQEKRHEQMVRVPERLETLLSDLLVCRRVHEHHTQQHHMACYASGLPVVYLDRCFGAGLVAFHVEETWD